MKKLLRRILAFILDMALVSGVVLLLSSWSVINPGKTKYDMAYDELNKSEIRYQAIEKEIDEYLEDAKFSEEEMNKFHEKHYDYSAILDKYEINEEMENKDIDELKATIKEEHQTVYNKYAYEITYNSLYSNIISMTVILLYFGVLQYLLKGQTLFKKLLRLKVTDKTDSKKNVPLWKMIIRSVIVNEVIFTIINIIVLRTININSYIVASYWIYQAQYIFEMIMIITIIVRDDGRGIHDILLGTKVVLFDKEENELEDKPLFGETIKPEEIETKKETLKKTTQTKRKKKEVVEAIKVKDEKNSNKTN